MLTFDRYPLPVICYLPLPDLCVGVRAQCCPHPERMGVPVDGVGRGNQIDGCLLYTSDAADERPRV